MSKQEATARTPKVVAEDIAFGLRIMQNITEFAIRDGVDDTYRAYIEDCSAALRRYAVEMYHLLMAESNASRSG